MTSEAPARRGSGWLNVAVDYGPLLVFFLVYRWYSPDNAAEDTPGEIFAVIRGTGAFIVASLIALGISKWRLGKVSPMLWLSTAMIVGFGALTIYFQDERFIQWKPSIVYALFAVVLLAGYARGKSLLKVLLETAFEGLDDSGWLKLSRNWGVFFIALCALNTVLIYVVSFETWLGMKLWLFLPLTFLFTFTQVPMLMRHGLAVEEKEEVVEDTPPPG
ncbi:inner membrane-spanning protein YciB [Aurantiacibacter spongiae]|uniref:Inner membrane-spanning protein YciB n=1 Tax=Aurantiacibacter spongiae TaxID=2488860 RepID=A0A3N5CXY2_9SPHN|nr:inner membrane-spanning protein YciB [Aurantiacibacter spongiae]RPF72490.1 septation protein IspZ [Aurantiacibacter spongiae]